MSEFKVGDKVVVKDTPFWPDDHFIQTVKAEHIGQWYMHSWRLAEPAEVQAGFRKGCKAFDDYWCGRSERYELKATEMPNDLGDDSHIENHISPHCQSKDV